MPIRILLADDHVMMRQGLRHILESNSEIDIVAEAGSGIEAVEAARRYRPEIAIVDVAMKELNGIEATAQILKHFEKDKRMIGFELRATVLGHVVRGAPPTAFDRFLATRLGVNAIRSLSENQSGILVGYQKGEVTRTPLGEIAGRTKPIETGLVELARILAK